MLFLNFPMRFFVVFLSLAVWLCFSFVLFVFLRIICFPLYYLFSFELLSSFCWLCCFFFFFWLLFFFCFAVVCFCCPALFFSAVLPAWLVLLVIFFSFSLFLSAEPIRSLWSVCFWPLLGCVSVCVVLIRTQRRIYFPNTPLLAGLPGRALWVSLNAAPRETQSWAVGWKQTCGAQAEGDAGRALRVYRCSFCMQLPSWWLFMRWHSWQNLLVEILKVLSCCTDTNKVRWEIATGYTPAKIRLIHFSGGELDWSHMFISLLALGLF